MREPETPAAKALTTKITAQIAEALDRSRPLGPEGLAKMTRAVGMILAGVLPPGLQGEAVAFHGSSAGDMWRTAPIGHTRFHQVIGAMERTGLIGTAKRWRVVLEGAYRAQAPIMWPTDALEAAAAELGVTRETRKADWRADPTIRAAASGLERHDVVVCRDHQGKPVVSDLLPGIIHVQDEVLTINAGNERAMILGAGRTVGVVRSFLYSLDFGGRFYAPVASLSAEDRLRITINDEPVAEVDVRASQLTVLLGLAGERSAPPDPYAFSDQIGRVAVKTWVVQSLGAGKPLRQWGGSTPAAVRQTSVAAVRRAALARYPMLEAIGDFIPPVLLDPLPATERGKAAGQWLVQREASIIAQAMLELSAAGVPVLPVHDSLVVPASAAEAAQRALTAAFVQQAGIVPRLTVDSAQQ